MGAPNLVQNGSLFGNLDTMSAIDSDVVDILCVDYHPPSLLAAAFVDTSEPLHQRINRVTKNPAEPVGLSDRGRIERGARADVLIVDPDPIPTVDTVFVEGRPIFDPVESHQ
jgi:alpha-D-ribose 1-methylphosphonate 5-triphosphate diphosphatase